MRQRQQLMVHALVILLFLPVMMAVSAGEAMMPTLRPTVAMAKTSQAKVRAAYNKKLKQLIRDKVIDQSGASYKYKDVYGGSSKELICQTKESAGSEDDIRVYTYKNGKVKLLCHTKAYGVDSLKFYKKSKGFVMHSSGHGGEIYRYFKMSKGKYRMTAMRSRSSVRGGAAENGSWSYFNGKNESISASSFKSRANKVTKGSAKKLGAPWKWSYMAG